MGIIIAVTAIIAVGMVAYAVYYKIQEKKRENSAVWYTKTRRNMRSA